MTPLSINDNMIFMYCHIYIAKYNNYNTCKCTRGKTGHLKCMNALGYTNTHMHAIHSSI